MFECAAFTYLVLSRAFRKARQRWPLEKREVTRLHGSIAYNGSIEHFNPSAIRAIELISTPFLDPRGYKVLDVKLTE